MIDALSKENEWTTILSMNGGLDHNDSPSLPTNSAVQKSLKLADGKTTSILLF